jgi:hypothetical protein
MNVTETHKENNTFTVDVNIPGHDPRVTTPLFHKTRLELIARDGGRCWICGCTEEESGHPLHAHHYPVERSFTGMIDFSAGSKIRQDIPDFDWANFDESDPYKFVDDMMFNGRLLCEPHHIGRDQGVHTLPEPVWLAQRYGKEGYVFSSVEIIHHCDAIPVEEKAP